MRRHGPWINPPIGLNLMGSKDPSTPPFRKLLRSGDFFSAERIRLSEPKMYNKGWNLQTCGPTPCLEMAMVFFLKCCSFCSCQLAKEWREKWQIIYRTVVINDNPVHIFTWQASKNPCLLDFVQLPQFRRNFTSFHQPRQQRYAQKPIPNRSTNPLKQSYSATLFQQTSMV